MGNQLLQKGIQPFWFWNGEMDPEEIRRQIRQMHQQGVRGFLIHPRQGLELPYLSRAFFERVRVAVQEAKDCGMEVWLYDEYPYPSGVTAGKVMLDHPEFCCKNLVKKTARATAHTTLQIDAPWGRVLSARAYPAHGDQVDFTTSIDLMDAVGPAYCEEIFQLSGLTAYNHKRFFTGTQVNRLYWEVPEGEWQVYLFVEQVMRHFKYFENYVDPLNPAAIRYFIETTHEVYKQYVGEEFGRTIKGFFTDEVTAFPPSQPWSPLLPDMIRERYGRDLLEVLPALTEDMGPETGRIRFEYWDTVTDAFIDSYDRQVYDWCEANHLMYIGEKPILRSKELEWVHIPGIDTGHAKVGAKIDPMPGNYRANGKIISSAAHFYHKPAALCEAFHSIGWGMTLQDMKWIFDWLAVSGVDFFVQHAYYYTTDGLQKHDAPPSSFCQMPWWKEQKCLSDYAVGLGKKIGTLKRDVDVLVVDPATSRWILPRADWREFDNRISAVMNSLMRAGCDFYVVDPQLLAQADIQNTDEEALLVLNGEAYRCLVLPCMNNIEDEAYRLIRRFAEAGGKIIAAGSVPSVNVQKEDSADWFREMHAKAITAPESTGSRVAAALGRASANLPDGVYLLKGTDTEGRKAFFAVNCSSRPQSITMPLKGFEAEDLTDGTCRPLSGESLELEPFASVYGSEAALASVPEPEEKLHISFDDVWGMQAVSSNALYLGEFRLTLPDGQSGVVGCYPIIDQMEELGMKLVTKTVPYFGCPKTLSFPPITAVYETEFDWKANSRAWLVMEPGTLEGGWKIDLNGSELRPEVFDNQVFYQSTNLAEEVTELLRPGRNHLKVQVECTLNSDGLRNPIYIMGDFAVRADQICTVEPARSAGIPGHYDENGLPFYAGEVRYSRSFEYDGEPEGRKVLDLSDLGTQDVCRVLLNGTDLGVCAWTPRTLEIPDGVLQQGENRIELVIQTTLSGLFEGEFFDIQSHRYIKHQHRDQEEERMKSFVAW
ncbi:MAG: hypothetical protein IJM90_04005 [Firmicutes bacterium]|nr:hypothetical protein [Bacillota bacterium]